MKTYLLGTVFAATVLLNGVAAAEYVNPITFPQKGDPTDVQVVIEIPVGSFTSMSLTPRPGSSSSIASSRCRWCIPPITA